MLIASSAFPNPNNLPPIPPDDDEDDDRQPLWGDTPTSIERCSACGCPIGHSDQGIAVTTEDGPVLLCEDCLDLEPW